MWKMNYLNDKTYNTASVIYSPDYFFYSTLTPVAPWLLAWLWVSELARGAGDCPGAQHPSLPSSAMQSGRGLHYPECLLLPGWSLQGRNSGEIWKRKEKGTYYPLEVATTRCSATCVAHRASSQDLPLRRRPPAPAQLLSSRPELRSLRSSNDRVSPNAVLNPLYPGDVEWLVFSWTNPEWCIWGQTHISRLIYLKHNEAWWKGGVSSRLSRDWFFTSREFLFQSQTGFQPYYP